jgi:hypothetical protein
MSAFVVEDKTINRIVAYLYRDPTGRNIRRPESEPFAKTGYYFHFGLMQSEADAGLNWSQAFEVRRRKLATDLFVMNCRAVDTRYPDKPAQSAVGFHPDDFGYKEVESPSPVAFAKMAQCLRYQCAEGKIPDEPLFKALSDSINIACANIVESLPEYEQCPWG